MSWPRASSWEPALTVRRDGGLLHPVPGDNWNYATYEAVLTVDPPLAQEFTTEARDRIWAALGAVLSHHGREDVQSLVIEQAAPPLPAIAADWREQAAQAPRQPPANQARRERAGDGLSLPGRPRIRQPRRACRLPGPRGNPARVPLKDAIAVLPLPGAKLRDAGVRTPDFVVVGNGRAAIIEVDGPPPLRRNPQGRRRRP